MKKLILFALAISSSASLLAQEQETVVDTTVIEKQVQVEKEFVPEITKVDRQEVTFSATEPEISKTRVTYSDSTKQIATVSEFHPLAAADMTILARERYKKGYFRGGAGFPLNWLVDFWYPIWENDKNYLDVRANHYGINSSPKTLIKTDVGVDFTHNLKQDQFYASANFKNSFFTYYAEDSINSSSREPSYYDVNNQKLRGDSLALSGKQSLIEVDANFGFRSLKDRKGWDYDVNLGYHLMSSYQLAEHQMVIGGGFVKKLGGFPFSVNMKANTFFYGTANLPFVMDTLANWKPQAVVELAPRYDMHWGDLRLRIGAKMHFSINKGQLFTASPDIKLDYNYKKLFNVFAGVGGNYRINSMASVLNQNRYFCPMEQIKENTYTPFDFFAGFNIKPVEGLVIAANANFQLIANEHYFYNKEFKCITTPNVWPLSEYEMVYSNFFTAEIQQTKLFTTSLDLSYNLKERYRFYAKGVFTTSDAVAWHLPMWQAYAGVDAKITDALTIKGNFYFASERFTKIVNKDPKPEISYRKVSLAPIYDLNLSASYTFKKNWSLFVQANNILSVSEKLRYQNWYKYDNIGFNVLLGASVAF